MGKKLSQKQQAAILKSCKEFQDTLQRLVSKDGINSISIQVDDGPEIIIAESKGVREGKIK